MQLSMTKFKYKFECVRWRPKGLERSKWWRVAYILNIGVVTALDEVKVWYCTKLLSHSKYDDWPKCCSVVCFLHLWGDKSALVVYLYSEWVSRFWSENISLCLVYVDLCFLRECCRGHGGLCKGDEIPSLKIKTNVKSSLCLLRVCNRSQPFKSRTHVFALSVVKKKQAWSPLTRMTHFDTVLLVVEQLQLSTWATEKHYWTCV